MAIEGKAFIGGSEIAPKPMPATAAKLASYKISVNTIYNNKLFLNNIIVPDRPIAIHRTSRKASISLAMPNMTCPSIISMNPFIRGTPGIKYSTLVAMAISEVWSLKITAVEATIEAINEHRAKTINTFTPFERSFCFDDIPIMVAEKTIPIEYHVPPNSAQNEALAKDERINITTG
jgi:hypothetical protein